MDEAEEWNRRTRTFLTGISEASIRQMIPCFKPREHRYVKGQTILSYPEADPVRGKMLAILREGQAKLMVIDEDGSSFQLETYRSGDVFGEMFALPIHNSLVLVEAETPCRVMYLDYHHVITPCEKVCAHHTQLISNLFIMAAQKAQELSFHLMAISQHTTRRKILYYLRYARAEAGASGSRAFKIPVSLTDLAAYLYVDRAAMMREIRSMNRDGLIESSQRSFRILAGDES